MEAVASVIVPSDSLAIHLALASKQNRIGNVGIINVFLLLISVEIASSNAAFQVGMNLASAVELPHAPNLVNSSNISPLPANLLMNANTQIIQVARKVTTELLAVAVRCPHSLSILMEMGSSSQMRQTEYYLAYQVMAGLIALLGLDQPQTIAGWHWIEMVTEL
jgi:hypothetical protein